MKGTLRIIMGLFTMVFLYTSCEMVGENSIYSELLKPVTVQLSGRVTALDTGDPIEGIEVQINQYNPTTAITTVLSVDGTELSALTAEDGTFTFSESIELEVDSYQHYIYLHDPNGAYYDNDSNLIYAVRDSSLDYSELQLAALSPQYFTVVTGTISDLIDDTPVEGLTVTLTNENDATEVYETLTDSDGVFSINEVPVSFYTMTLDGSELSTPYIIEDSELILETSQSNSLGEILVAPQNTNDDLRIVLSWTNEELNLDGLLTIFNDDLNINHLGTKQVNLNSTLFSVNPGLGFAEGTAYWPESLGGEEKWRGNRHELYPGNPLATELENDDWIHHYSGATMVAEVGLDGNIPELCTLYKRNPLDIQNVDADGYPNNLAYYYDFKKDNEDWATYYPIGMAIYQVLCPQPDESIYESGAEVKVYQGSRYLGKFTVADLVTDQSESNRKFWPVIQIEIGYTTANPSSPDDIYFRIVPYGSGATIPNETLPGFFYQETQLPGNLNFTGLLQNDEIQGQYKIVGQLGLNTVLFAETGGIYTYDNQCNREDLSWSSQAYQTNDGVFTHGFYWGTYPGETDQDLWSRFRGPQASRIYLSRVTDGSSSNNLLWGPALFDEVPPPGVQDFTSLLEEEDDLSEYTATGVTQINDHALLKIGESEYYYLLLATSEGPRGASTFFSDDETSYMGLTPVLSGFPDFWNDSTADQVFDSVTPAAMRHALGAKNIDGSLTHFALIGGEGLYILVSRDVDQIGDIDNAVTPDEFGEYITGDPYWGPDLGTFHDIKNDENGDGDYLDASDWNLSHSSFRVTAIAQVPSNGGNYHFIVAAMNGSNAELWSVECGVLGEVVKVKRRTYNGSKINDLMYLTVEQDLILMMATDTGIVVCAEWDPSNLGTYLQKILGGMAITRMFDYDGSLGLLVEDSGMIYGPYPERLRNLNL